MTAAAPPAPAPGAEAPDPTPKPDPAAAPAAPPSTPAAGDDAIDAAREYELASRRRRLARRLGRFLAAILAKTDRDALGGESAALAFATVLGLIPLLASFLWVGNHVFREYREQILGALSEFLPYSEDSLIDHIEAFLAQAQSIQGVGLLGFAFVAVLTFASVEETINRIWGVSSQRPWWARIRAFILILIFGPLMIGAVLSTFAILRTSLEFERLFQRSLLLQWTPAAASIFGLTLLYWLVPYTHVRFRAAVTGGVTAALLLGLLRSGFRIYLEWFPTLNVVYGSFALALIFMLSIQVAWFLILLGAEVAYGMQHWGWMSAGAAPSGQDPAWLGVVALLVLDGHRDTRAFTAREELADEMEVPVGAVRLAVEPLVDKGWVEARGKGGAGYRLGADLSLLSVGDVLSVYDLPDDLLERPLPKDSARRLRWLRERLRGERRSLLGLTLEALGRAPEEKP